MGDRRYRVTWSRAAEAALDEAIGFIATDAPAAALDLLERVLGAAESLNALAERGRTVPEIGHPSIRQILVDPFRLMYRIDLDDVEIVAFVHQARDLGLWLRDEGDIPR